MHLVTATAEPGFSVQNLCGALEPIVSLTLRAPSALAKCSA